MITSQMRKSRGSLSNTGLAERMPKAAIKDANFYHVGDVVFNK